ncbi:MAG TPA: adventurous gliding motility protein GltC [Anaeromyxobacteraceae bacterium]|jgi:tetratricopeptide (TPR) repeat protein|nr:adventurous gliding motility protein GltC [Anaeromyxobacteraceae bacterium]
MARLRPAPVLAALLLLGPAAARPQGLGIDLSAPEKPAPGAPPAQPPPGARAAATGEPGARLAAVRKLVEQRRYEEAATAAFALQRDPAAAAVRGEAAVLLSRSLSGLGLDQAAVAELSALLAAPGQGAAGAAVEELGALGERDPANEHAVSAALAGAAAAGLPPAVEGPLEVAQARWAYERGRALEEAGRGAEAKRSYAEALRLAGSSGAAPAQAAQARFVEGLVRYAEGDQPAALESFKEVVRLTNPRRGPAADPRLRALAFLQLARIHYEHRQNRYAIFYYDRLPLGGEGWLEGLWESSYAHYRIGDYEKALGNLITLQSSYFKDEYFPESYVLKAIIYYENCRFPEAREILEGFAREWGPLQAELAKLAARPGPPEALYRAFAEAGAGPDRAMSRRVVKAALADRNVRRLDLALRAVDQQAGPGLGRRSAAFRDSELGRHLQATLASARARLGAEAGARLRQQLEAERDSLRDLLQQALRIRIEVTRREREALEASLATGQRPDVTRAYRYSTAVSDEHLYWPYDGEFWRDELGSYTYTLTRGCREAPEPASGAAAKSGEGARR